MQINNEHLFTAYYLKGKLSYFLEDFKSALINLNNAQLLSDSSTKVNLLKALCYMKLENIKKAKEEIDSIVFTHSQNDRKRFQKFSDACSNDEIKEAIMKFII